MKTYSTAILVLVLFGFPAFLSCDRILSGEPADNELLDGPVDGLPPDQLSRFLNGDEAFNEVFTAGTGLGPLFVSTSCGSCHPGDGKGHPFTTLTRYGQTDSTGNQFLEQGGPQLQNRALPGFEPETIPEGIPFSKLTPPAVTGLGFLEMVPDEDILAMAVANENHPDGIRGRPNWINLPAYVAPRPGAISQNGRYIGRFGKKASVYNLLHQTVDAYSEDIGITSLFRPTDIYSGLEIDPEVSNQTIHDVVFYLQTLKEPVPRNQNDPEVVRGKNLFVEIGCESCHKQTLRTGNSNIEVLSNREFHPYTDLLIHDMGSDLSDGYTEGSAEPSEWRTPPLWGLGLAPDSQGGRYFLMHDGRAGSIEEAISMHGGEAEIPKSNFIRLSEDEKKSILKFLESL